MPSAVIVVPCFNEAARLDRRKFVDFVKHDPTTNFLFVNDGSRDRTLELLEELHQLQPHRVSFLHLKYNQGKGEAIRQGMLLALGLSPLYVGYWDADLATPLEEILAFRAVLDRRSDIELVIGSRLPLLGRSIQRRPMRQQLGRLFARAAALSLGLRVYDTQCGAKLFRTTAALEQSLLQPLLSRWIIDVELMARLTLARRGTALPPMKEVIYEQPLEMWREVAGSKLRTGDFFFAIVELAQIYWTYLLPGRVWPYAVGSRVAGSGDAAMAELETLPIGQLSPRSEAPSGGKAA